MVKVMTFRPGSPLWRLRKRTRCFFHDHVWFKRPDGLTICWWCLLGAPAGDTRPRRVR